MDPSAASVSPGGSIGAPSADGVIVKLYGAVPPSTVKRCEYAVPTVALRIPDARLRLETLSVNVRRIDVPTESVAIRSNAYWPTVLGTPARTVAPGVSID